jgi:hypothetical protein
MSSIVHPTTIQKALQQGNTLTAAPLLPARTTIHSRQPFPRRKVMNTEGVTESFNAMLLYRR